MKLEMFKMVVSELYRNAVICKCAKLFKPCDKTYSPALCL